MTHDDSRHAHIAIIGSGFAGLGSAIRLKEDGVHDFIIFERREDVGGTWHDNRYPGCACDVPSNLYSFSFELNPRWSRAFSPQPEIYAYLKDCAQRYGILPHIRFDHAVESASWDEAAQMWRLETSKGSFTADIVIAAVGALSEPSFPELQGIDRFEGPAFHSAQWDPTVNLENRKIAVVGTGASAIQFVPEIQPKAAKLVVFQRTPPWILPRRNPTVSKGLQAVFGLLPAVQRLTRGAVYAVAELFGAGFRHPWLMRPLEGLARRYLERCVPDPVLRAKLTPNYTIGCKRVLFSNTYLDALVQSNVEVVTDRIHEVRSHSIVTADGREHSVDAIVFGTGFQVSTIPFGRHVRGRDGRTLDEVWAGSPKAHLGTTMAGFPNLFFLLGPNTGLGHSSVVYMIECQIAHVMHALRYMRARGIATIEPKAEAQATFVADVDRRLQTTVWTTGGCSSWYIDKTGRNSTLWPDATWRFKKRVAKFDPAEYLLCLPAAQKGLEPLPVRLVGGRNGEGRGSERRFARGSATAMGTRS